MAQQAQVREANRKIPGPLAATFVADGRSAAQRLILA
jgi:hypothetical protein